MAELVTKQGLAEAQCLCAVRPFSELVRRVHRVLVLLVVGAHGGGVIIQGVRRHALVNIVFRDLNLASELDVVVLLPC
jgi:hypothetical protein